MAYTTIDNPALFFKTLLWTGDGTSPRTLSGLDFQPDWVWGKRRDDAAGHNIFDSVRTAGSDKNLQSNSNGAEGSGAPGTYGYLSAFTSDGFTVTAGSSDNAYWNNNTATYVSWNWKAGDSTSSNGNGSITSTVSHNSTAGFSIGTYTGNGTAGATVGHGLGAIPDVLIVKERGNTNSWVFSHKDLTDQSGYYLLLNSTGAQATDNWFNNTSPTSTVFSTNSTPTNRSSGTYVFYAFKEVKGFSKFGKWTGNGNADGTFVYTGFRPAFVMLKDYTSSSGYNWIIIDSTRSPANGIGKRLQPSSSLAEYTDVSNFCDFTANGFKWTGSQANWNGSGVGYIYMAFAEHPFVTEGTKAAGTAR